MNIKNPKFDLMTIITQTPRLVVRQFLPDEEDLFVNLLTDERINKHLPKRDLEQIKKLFEDTLAEYAAGLKLCRWAVVDADNNNFVGLGILKYNESEPEKSELGYVLHLAYHGKGVATELALALVDYGFHQVGLQEIFAVTTHENIPSQRVLEKAGLVKGENMVRNGEDLAFFRMTL